MNICQTCRHWDRDRACNSYSTNDVGANQHGYTDDAQLAKRKEALAKDDAVDFDSDRWVRIFTGPNFGCIHHEAKEP